MTEKQLTKSLEDCLETILDLTRVDERVRVTDLAAALKISKPSVNYAIGALSEMGLVNYTKYGRITLTQEGEKKAAEVLSLHVLLQQFLTDIVGVSEATAEIDACKIEHILSPETIDRIRLLVRGNSVFYDCCCKNE